MDEQKFCTDLGLIGARTAYFSDTLNVLAKADFNNQLDGEVNALFEVLAEYAKNIHRDLDSAEDEYRKILGAKGGGKS